MHRFDASPHALPLAYAQGGAEVVYVDLSKTLKG